MSSDLDVYQPPAGIGQYQAGIVMTPENAKALDDQVRLCTEAVLREGTDYGIIPGTSGEKTLWRPGAQKLLQWFRLECTCDRIDVERDDDGRKHGITYRAEVGRGLKTATPVILATCEGTADYDESKFYQTAEQVQRKAEDRERAWAAKDGRPARPTKWQGLPEYRADWNALMKRAQKRAIVGAVNDATAAGGIFTDREEDDGTPTPQDFGPSWYEQAIETALASTETEPGGELQALFTGAAEAHKKGLINRRQQDHVQNTVRQRLALLKKATPVNVEDLGRQAAEAPAAGEDSSSPEPKGKAAGAAPTREAQPPPPQDTPDDEAADSDTERHRELVSIVWQHAARLGYPRPDKETDEQTRSRLADIAALAGVSEISSTSDLDIEELSRAADALARCKNRAALDKLLKTGETGDGDA